MTLNEVARELARRLIGLFVADAHGVRPAHGADWRYAQDPHWRDLVLFYEYFDGDTGRGLGASHQTGWTALVLQLIDNLGRRRTNGRFPPALYAGCAGSGHPVTRRESPDCFGRHLDAME